MPSADDLDLRVVTKRAPTEAELKDLLFAFRVVKHVKSNAIVYAKNLATVAVGAGQMSRVDAARIAARKAAEIGREAGLAGHADARQRGRLGRLFPLPRRPHRGDRSGRHGGDSTRRIR